MTANRPCLHQAILAGLTDGDGPAVATCLEPIGHAGDHRNVDGFTWEAIPPRFCLAEADAGDGSRYVCTLARGHDGDHVNRTSGTSWAEGQEPRRPRLTRRQRAASAALGLVIRALERPADQD